MDCRKQVVVVVPSLNEARTIHSLVRQIRVFLPQVLVIDDGSSDSTASQAQQAGAIVLRHSRPQGKGAALRSGFAAARKRGFEWALTMDGDGQHVPSDIPSFLARLQNGSAAMFIGNRMLAPRSMPLVRRLVNTWLSRRLSDYCGFPIPDSQCGFRLVNLDAWTRLPFAARHFEVESELIVRFAKAGLPIEFLQVQTRYASEQSKIHPFRDTYRWFRWWKSIRQELAGRDDLISCEPRFDPTPQDVPA